MNNPMDFNGSFTESVGLETGAVPTSIYTDAAQYEVERERIFRRAWLMVGRAERIPKPGDFFVKQLAVLNASVIVARSEDGTIRAFHNVCAHRANIVEHRASGNAKRFVCRYHSWGYDNAGQLAHVPDESGFFGLDKKKCGLTPVALEIWEGWIFINLATEPEVSLAEFLGPIADALTGIEYQNPDHPIVLRGEFNANWKAVAENFSEAYHVASIHPKTLAPFYIGQQNPFGRPISVRLHGPHRSMSWWLNPIAQPFAKSKVAQWLFSADHSVTGTRKAGQVNSVVEHKGVNPTKHEHWASDVNWFFPNWHLQISANQFWTHEFWPTSASTTVWEARFYYKKATTVRERLQLEHFTSHITDSMLEDLGNIESMQVGMASGAKPVIYFNESEVLCRHGIEQVVKWSAAPTAKGALD
ncbi:aromatic ring-hydroxylating dioxygenase subunit alpha [Burkholderia sp. Ac-20384]|uniref:aromatic ring-hydroxylating oxygenase subunit alpha n=1 Tax=Burkholderia TaxID=32008 RepID=UPI0014548706|nr:MULTISPECIES: aromatic ring-hydroxylating dioxygenase subunit alpha [Burkholderia]MBN3822786.1 aromatic ring-hydroxylating dioxygenase subunit alpha [Burkholderia sp. Ac-20384]VWC04807.1 (Fe-S)-binding protein [Burkholderia lata]